MFTENHLHIEGLEVSNNPVLLDLYVAMRTKRVRVGQLGIVLSASNPLRVAEDIAMLDRMTGGRAIAGFARGFQRRWVDVLGQHLPGLHAVVPGDRQEMDRLNREAFEECFQIVKLAWTEDVLSFDDRFWKIPPGHPVGHAADRPVRRRGAGRRPAPGGRGPEAGPAAAPPDLPAGRRLGGDDRLVREAGRDGGAAALAAGGRGPLPARLRGGVRQAAGARHRHPARCRHRRHGGRKRGGSSWRGRGSTGASGCGRSGSAGRWSIRRPGGRRT